MTDQNLPFCSDLEPASHTGRVTCMHLYSTTSEREAASAASNLRRRPADQNKSSRARTGSRPKSHRNRWTCSPRAVLQLQTASRRLTIEALASPAPTLSTGKKKKRNPVWSCPHGPQPAYVRPTPHPRARRRLRNDARNPPHHTSTPQCAASGRQVNIVRIARYACVHR
mgnify:CR=1 FL=1